MSTSKKDVFKEIVLVNVNNGIWSGYKRTTEGDLAKMNATLPGGGIITKGGKKIFPTETFKPFNTLKKEISRELMSIGVSALGSSSRIIPSNQMKEVQKYLDDCKIRFNEMLADFMANYDTNLKNHLDQITEPVVREIVERSTLTKAEAVKRFRFVTDVFNIVPQGDGEGLVNNLVNKLFQEVSTSAREAYEKSFLGKPRVGQRALNQIVSIRTKLAGLSMLDGKNIQPIVDSMDEVLDAMPKEGWIEGVNYSALIGLVNMLCEPEDMLKHAEKIQQGIASSVKAAGTASPAPVVQAPVVAVVEPKVVTEAEPQQASLEITAEKEIEPEIETRVEVPSQPQLALIDNEKVQDEVATDKEEVSLPLVNTIPAPKPVKKVAAFF